MGSPWATHGVPMGNPSLTYEQPMGKYLPISYPWTTHMGNPWLAHATHRQVFTHKLPMDYSLAAHWLLTDSHWKVVGCPWGAHGLLMSFS